MFIKVKILILLLIIISSCSKDTDENDNDIPILQNDNWFNEKFWCHRVNTIEQAKKLESLWQGLELDIFYENSKLIVKHDADDTAKLTLQEFMNALKNPQSHYFWFDLKNLDANNCIPLSSDLIEVIKKYSSIQNCIVESWMPDYMSGFVNQGCHTSFFINFSGLTNNQEYLQRVDNITQYVIRNRISAISTNIYEYDLMKFYFPDFNKLTWYSGNSQTIVDSLRDVISDDDKLRVCLFEESFY